MGVILSFDIEGNKKVNPYILEILERYDLPAIFFFEGRWIEKFPKEARRLSRKFYIGNHTYSHQNLVKINTIEQQNEIQKCDELLNKILKKSRKKIFRAPFNKINSQIFTLLKKTKYHYDSSVVKYFRRNPGNLYDIKELFVNIPSDYFLFVRLKLNDSAALKFVNSLLKFHTLIGNMVVLDFHPTHPWGINSHIIFFTKLCALIQKKFEPSII